MYKVAMIGDRESTLGFMALGFSVFEASDEKQAGRLLRELAGESKYAVIFITENLAAGLGEELSRYSDRPLPAVTVIPGRSGNQGMGVRSLREAVVRAVGADILFKDEEGNGKK